MATTYPLPQGDEVPDTYMTTEHAARVLRVSTATMRRRIVGGEIAGAVRIGGRGSAWRVPAAAVLAVAAAVAPSSAPMPGGHVTAAATTAPRLVAVATRRGGPADTASGRPDVTSTHRAPVDLVDTAARVVASLSAVTTRPATALAAVLPILASVAMRHAPDADGRCMACKWPAYPCPDADLVATAVGRVADVVLDGAR